MQRIANRGELLRFISENAGRNAIRDSCRPSNCTVLGGFSSIPPFDRPGYIVRVRSLYSDRQWNIAVVCHEHEHIYRCAVIDAVPYKNWMGYGWDRSDYSLMVGDVPKEMQVRSNARDKSSDTNASSQSADKHKPD